MSKDTDDIWMRDEVESPCVKTCTIHPETRLCIGCLRSIDEITDWGRFSPAERRQIMDALPARKPLVQRRRGRRRANPRTS